jgi:RNA polymerase sigma factor (sigma-70 family)
MTVTGGAGGASPKEGAGADDVSNEALMSDYIAGDELAFTRLFDRIAPRVHAFFLRSFGKPEVADDLTQQTFLKMHAARRQFRNDSPVKPWIFAIAARVRLDEYRRRKRLPRLDEDGLAAADEVPLAPPAADPAERAEVKEQVGAALARLPESQRVVVHLHRFEGLTFGEIARILDTTEGAVRIRAFRAYEKLRQDLQGLVGGQP